MPIMSTSIVPYDVVYYSTAAGDVFGLAGTGQRILYAPVSMQDRLFEMRKITFHGLQKNGTIVFDDGIGGFPHEFRWTRNHILDKDTGKVYMRLSNDSLDQVKARLVIKY